jgi:hypothetical protein
VNTLASLARPLERALFEEGFEVMAIEGKSSFSSTRNTLAALHAAGFVVIYQNPSLQAEERLDLQSAAGGHFFDLEMLDLPEADAEALERILALVEALRIPPQPENWEG